MSDNKKSEPKFDELRFIRVFTPVHVPKELIEQIKHREYDVDEWYSYLEQICVSRESSGQQLNPLCMLYVIADQGNKVVGVLWCEVAPLERSLVIQTFSMKREYWSRGHAVKLLADKAKEIAKQCNLKKIYWMTAYPRHSQHYGFKRSRQTLMEYEEVDCGPDSDGRIKACGEHRSDDAPATATNERVAQ